MRVWEVKFEVHQPIASLPVPHVVVEEVQNSPVYGHDGRFRRDRGGQLAYTMSGRGRLRVRNEVFDLTPGVAFLHNHRDPDIGYFYPEDGTDVWRFLWIGFNGELAEKMVTDIVARYGYRFELPWERGIVKKMYSYKNFRGAVQILSPLGGMRLVIDVLTGLGEALEKRLIGSPQSLLVARAQEYILENVAVDIGVAEIAEALNVSREHLSRVFREQTSMSPKDYILSRKMSLACDLLLYSSLSCKEVSERVGFEDPTSFSRAFRRLVGMSPGGLRENGYRPDI